MKRFSLMPSSIDRFSGVFGTLCLLSSPALGQVPERLLVHGPVQAVHARLDSLEQVAIFSSDRDSKSLALTRITQIGRAWARHGGTTPMVVYPGIVVRLRRIYQSSEPYGRGSIVQSLVRQGERTEAIAWLRELLKSADMSDSHISVAEEAVQALALMGPAGEEELRRFHLSGETDPGMQKMLDVLARTGYRRPPGER